MASLYMGRTRYPLNRETVNKYVDEKIGNYALGYIKTFLLVNKKTNESYKRKRFIPQYVGRSDTNLRKEIIQQGIKNKVDKKGNPIHTHFAFIHKRTPKSSYILECKNFHDLGDKGKLDNIRHPKRPSGFNKTILPCAKNSCNN